MSTGTSKNSNARRFRLVRDVDVSGTSGTGVVAEGVEFSNGRVVMHWISQLDSLEIIDNMHVLIAIHGHEGRTKVEWMDV